MFHFNARAFVISVLLFAALVVIAVYVTDDIVRPFLGDVLVVVWLYFVMRSVLNYSKNIIISGVLIFAYAVEFAQYFQLLSWLGLDHIYWLRIVLGATFDIKDLLAYSVGAVMLFLLNVDTA
ncbi:DUF2809 domain-containing protein [Reinekea thalattae]|uniref:DUF2809 domain-containing protein n=1 Tax=Reinekea thalattae TaxID=2593301 RepID=A0A5C8Z3U2_9GAMM|nr:DUF2809 domain-containing protein [Reinekea thalattae]TXR51893.1 DUF2809 domain-containing protein [Reinekea thalattae]